MLLIDEHHYAKAATWTTSQEDRTKKRLKLCPFPYNIIVSYFLYDVIIVSIYKLQEQLPHQIESSSWYALPYTNELSSENFNLPIYL